MIKYVFAFTLSFGLWAVQEISNEEEFAAKVEQRVQNALRCKEDVLRREICEQCYQEKEKLAKVLRSKVRRPILTEPDCGGTASYVKDGVVHCMHHALPGTLDLMDEEILKSIKVLPINCEMSEFEPFGIYSLYVMWRLDNKQKCRWYHWFTVLGDNRIISSTGGCSVNTFTSFRDMVDEDVIHIDNEGNFTNNKYSKIDGRDTENPEEAYVVVVKEYSKEDYTF